MISEYRYLVKLVARAFYSENIYLQDIIEKDHSKNLMNETAGICIAILDKLVEEEWIEENNLSVNLRIDSELLRCVMQFFEKEHFIHRIYIREKLCFTVITKDRQIITENGKVYTFVSLDYPGFIDSIRMRFHVIRSNLCHQLNKLNLSMKNCHYQCVKKAEFFMDNKDCLIIQKTEFSSSYIKTPSCDLFLTKFNEVNQKITLNLLCDGSKNNYDDFGLRDTLSDIITRFDDQLKPITEQLIKLSKFKTLDKLSLENWFRKISKKRERNSIFSRLTNADHYSIVV